MTEERYKAVLVPLTKKDPAQWNNIDKGLVDEAARLYPNLLSGLGLPDPVKSRYEAMVAKAYAKPEEEWTDIDKGLIDEATSKYPDMQKTSYKEDLFTDTLASFERLIPSFEATFGSDGAKAIKKYVDIQRQAAASQDPLDRKNAQLLSQAIESSKGDPSKIPEVFEKLGGSNTGLVGDQIADLTQSVLLTNGGMAAGAALGFLVGKSPAAAVKGAAAGRFLGAGLSGGISAVKEYTNSLVGDAVEAGKSFKEFLDSPEGEQAKWDARKRAAIVGVVESVTDAVTAGFGSTVMKPVTKALAGAAVGGTGEASQSILGDIATGEKINTGEAAIGAAAGSVAGFPQALLARNEQGKTKPAQDPTVKDFETPQETPVIPLLEDKRGVPEIELERKKAIVDSISNLTDNGFNKDNLLSYDAQKLGDLNSWLEGQKDLVGSDTVDVGKVLKEQVYLKKALEALDTLDANKEDKAAVVRIKEAIEEGSSVMASDEKTAVAIKNAIKNLDPTSDKFEVQKTRLKDLYLKYTDRAKTAPKNIVDIASDVGFNPEKSKTLAIEPPKDNLDTGNRQEGVDKAELIKRIYANSQNADEVNQRWKVISTRNINELDTEELQRINDYITNREKVATDTKDGVFPRKKPLPLPDKRSFAQRFAEWKKRNNITNTGDKLRDTLDEMNNTWRFIEEDNAERAKRAAEELVYAREAVTGQRDLRKTRPQLDEADIYAASIAGPDLGSVLDSIIKNKATPNSERIKARKLLKLWKNENKNLGPLIEEISNVARTDADLVRRLEKARQDMKVEKEGRQEATRETFEKANEVTRVAPGAKGQSSLDTKQSVALAKENARRTQLGLPLIEVQPGQTVKQAIKAANANQREKTTPKTPEVVATAPVTPPLPPTTPKGPFKYTVELDDGTTTEVFSRKTLGKGKSIQVPGRDVSGRVVSKDPVSEGSWAFVKNEDGSVSVREVKDLLDGTPPPAKVEPEADVAPKAPQPKRSVAAEKKLAKENARRIRLGLPLVEDTAKAKVDEVSKTIKESMADPTSQGLDQAKTEEVLGKLKVSPNGFTKLADAITRAARGLVDLKFVTGLPENVNGLSLLNMAVVSTEKDLDTIEEATWHEFYHAAKNIGIISPEATKTLEDNREALQSYAETMNGIRRGSLAGLADEEVQAQAFGKYVANKNRSFLSNPIKYIFNKVLAFRANLGREVRKSFDEIMDGTYVKSSPVYDKALRDVTMKRQSKALENLASQSVAASIISSIPTTVNGSSILANARPTSRLAKGAMLAFLATNTERARQSPVFAAAFNYMRTAENLKDQTNQVLSEEATVILQEHAQLVRPVSDLVWYLQDSNQAELSRGPGEPIKYTNKEGKPVLIKDPKFIKAFDDVTGYFYKTNEALASSVKDLLGTATQSVQALKNSGKTDDKTLGSIVVLENEIKELNDTLGKYDAWKKQVYVPRHRYGSRFVEVKQKSTGKTLYRFHTDLDIASKGSLLVKSIQKQTSGPLRDDLQRHKDYFKAQGWYNNPDIEISPLKTLPNLKTGSSNVKQLESIIHLVSSEAGLENEYSKALGEAVRSLRAARTLSKFTLERNNVPGQSVDIARIFAVSAGTYSQAISMNKTSKARSELEESMDKLAESADNNFLSEINGVRNAVNYFDSTDPWGQRIRSMNFLMMMAGNVSAGALQLAGSVQGIGLLTTYDANYIKHAGNLSKEMSWFTNQMLSVENIKDVDQPAKLVSRIIDTVGDKDKRQFLQKAMRQGSLSTGLTNESKYNPQSDTRTARAQVRVKLSEIGNYTAAVISIPEIGSRIASVITNWEAMKHPKVLSRFLEIHKDDPSFAEFAMTMAGSGYSPRETAALYLTENQLGRYGASGRAVYERGAIGALVFGFFKFAINGCEQLTRQYLRAVTKGDWRAAVGALAGSMTMYTLGGALAIPAVALSEGISELVDEEDFDNKVRRTIAEYAKNATPEELNEYYFGFLANMAGVDIASRVAIGKHPVLDLLALGQKVLTDRNISSIKDVLPGTMGYYVGAAKDWWNITTGGDKQDALQTFLTSAPLVPAVLAQPIKAYGIGAYGTTMSGGTTILRTPEEISAGDIARRALGLTSTKSTTARQEYRQQTQAYATVPEYTRLKDDAVDFLYDNFSQRNVKPPQEALRKGKSSALYTLKAKPEYRRIRKDYEKALREHMKTYPNSGIVLQERLKGFDLAVSKEVAEKLYGTTPVKRKN